MTERFPRLLLPFALVLAAAVGCGGFGLPGGSGPTTRPTPQTDQVITGEVAWVDANDRQLEVQHTTGRVVARFDADTQVLYQGREYRPENLEPGDVVRMEVAGSGYQNVYARRIEVVESVRKAADRRVSGEVERVDTGRKEIFIATSSGDRVVEYDERTQVVYQGQQYRPENLERGDLVRVEVRDDRNRNPYAETIEVTQSVQDRRPGEVPGDRAEAERLTGTVQWIDEERGEFGLLTDRRETFTVAIPYAAGQAVRDRFTRLERGDFVRIEAAARDGERVELVRFL
ncbi:MAG TPA: hypothetical protein VMR44_09535 [Thermoanaerobaculia bacterium]|nr:hypothetical protein [Thermoanaerobaculia bacterium]